MRQRTYEAAFVVKTTIIVWHSYSECLQRSDAATANVIVQGPLSLPLPEGHRGGGDIIP